jgi:cytochrome c oxidase subunit 2
LPVSPIAAQWSWLFNLYLMLGVLIGAVVLGLLIILAIRFRMRPGEPDAGEAGDDVPETPRAGLRTALVMTALISVVLFGLTVGTMGTVNLIEKVPSDALTIRVVGFQWGWRFIYPDGRELIGELRVPYNTPVVLEVTSQDVFHAFGLPDLKVKVDAIPGRVNRIWFVATEECAAQCHQPLRCYELCGAGHALMKAKLTVMDPQAFFTWLGGT